MLSAECFCFPITCDYGVYGDFPCFSDHCDDVGSRERRRFLDLLPLLRVSHSDISGSEDSCGTAALGCADNCPYFSAPPRWILVFVPITATCPGAAVDHAR